MKYQILDCSGYKEIEEKYKLGGIAARILATKNLAEEEINDLLFSKVTTNEFDLSFLDTIVEHIASAKNKQDKILICGDYDCDGVCATTILYDALKRFGCDVGYYIPDRFKEGYGVNIATMKLAVEKGYKMIITVDNGVKATVPLKYARSHGIFVVLSDHHSYKEKDIECDCFLHPKVLPTFFKDLSGAGLAYILSKRLIGDEPFHTVLAAVATIGDMVGVRDANRVIIKEGIALLNRMKFLPVEYLADDKNKWDVVKVAFQIVPKINALGRLADKANANTLVKYFLIQDPYSLETMAQQIKELNLERKAISATCENLAMKMVSNEDDFHILYSKDFHEGLNGIVASKIANKYNKSTMVLSKHGDALKGSIRSVGVDLTTFFDEFKESLISYGGHKMAAGISLHEDQLEALKLFSNSKIKDTYQEELKTYLEIPIEEITIENIEDLNKIEPFGVDFSKPTISIVDKVETITTLSKGLHLKFVSNQVNYLYFQHGDQVEKYANNKYRFLGELSINEFRNNKTITMILSDVLK